MGCSAGTSWYIQPVSSSLVPYFQFHCHLGIDLYMLCNSANDSKLSWQSISSRSSDKQHSRLTALQLWVILPLIALTFFICITQKVVEKCTSIYGQKWDLSIQILTKFILIYGKRYLYIQIVTKCTSIDRQNVHE